MNRTLLVVALASVLFASSALAQFPAPQLHSVFPCGAQQGTTVECTINGSDLSEATGLYFSHSGISAEPAGTNKFKIAVSADVPVGRYDVRAICPLGVSSCRSFVVGDRPEFIEKEPNNQLDTAQRVTLPITINGQINGGIDLDHFVFSLKKGERIFINCWAWRLDSKLDATLMIYDSAGKEVAYNGDYYGKDPFLDFTAEADGDYTVKIWDFIYSNGPDLVYRLEIGSLPHLDAILPAAVVLGKATTVTLYGRNLPGGTPAPAEMQVQGHSLEMLTQEITLTAEPNSLHTGEASRPAQALLDGKEFRLVTSQGASNPLFVGFTSDPVVLEQEPNNSRETAQHVSIPCEVSGMFSPVGDLDYYAFTAKKNEKYVIEIFGERQSGLTDPNITGFDPKGKRIFSGDDVGKNIGQLRFTTSTRDARWDFTAPADGEYTVQVRDLYHQQRGDPRFTYRLSIRAPQPDFRLMAVPTAEIQPDATIVRQGGNYWLDVLAHRNDGFDEPITVTAEELPPGVTCEPVVIGPGKTSAPLVFHAATDATIGHAAIRIVGKSRIAETDVTRIARGGGLTWATVNTPGIARMSDTILLAVRSPAPFALMATPAAKEVAAGGTLSIKVQVTRADDWSDDVQLAGFDLPTNTTVALVTIKKGATEGMVELKLPANVKPGRFTFTINGSGQVARNYPLETTPAKRDKNIRGLLPSNAITIDVLPDPAKK